MLVQITQEALLQVVDVKQGIIIMVTLFVLVVLNTVRPVTMHQTVLLVMILTEIQVTYVSQKKGIMNRLDSLMFNHVILNVNLALLLLLIVNNVLM